MSAIDDMEALARRAVACPKFRWMAGMRVVRPDGTFPLRIVQSGCLAHEGAPEDGWPPRVQVAKGLHLHDLPDLTDPATLGCLLALVREAWGERGTCSIQSLGIWAVRASAGKWLVGFAAEHATEAAALVAALEAAP